MRADDTFVEVFLGEKKITDCKWKGDRDADQNKVQFK